MISGETIDNFFHKKRSVQDINDEMGQVKSCYLTHALDNAIRSEAASGGTVSALLIYLLETSQIDGAIVCYSEITHGKVRAHFKIAYTRNERLAARGSKYVATHFLKEVLSLIKKFKGRLAVVGLPCDISHLKRWINKNPSTESRVLWTKSVSFAANRVPKEIKPASKTTPPAKAIFLFSFRKNKADKREKRKTPPASAIYTPLIWVNIKVMTKNPAIVRNA